MTRENFIQICNLVSEGYSYEGVNQKMGTNRLSCLTNRGVGYTKLKKLLKEGKSPEEIADQFIKPRVKKARKPRKSSPISSPRARLDVLCNIVMGLYMMSHDEGLLRDAERMISSLTEKKEG